MKSHQDTNGENDERTGTRAADTPGDEIFIYNGQLIDPPSKERLIEVILTHESIREIPYGAFSECHNLRKFHLHSRLTRIGDRAFKNCSNLQDVNWEDASSLSHIGRYAFRKSGLINVPLPNSLTHIGYQAFQECKKLERINFPESIISMGNDVCYSCSALTSLKIAEGIIELSPYSFAHCKKLECITLPSTVRVIRHAAFWKAKKLREIEWGPNGALESVGNWAFADCFSLQQVWLPDSLQLLGGDAFGGCSNLLHLRFPPNLARVEYNNDGTLLNRCNSLIQVTGRVMDEESIHRLNRAEQRDPSTVFHSDGQRRVLLGDAPCLWPRIWAPLLRFDESDFRGPMQARHTLVWNQLRENLPKLLEKRQTSSRKRVRV